MAARRRCHGVDHRCLGQPEVTVESYGLLLVVSATAFLPSLTAIDGRISAPGPELALLRHVSFFRSCPSR